MDRAAAGDAAVDVPPAAADYVRAPPQDTLKAVAGPAPVKAETELRGKPSAAAAAKDLEIYAATVDMDGPVSPLPTENGDGRAPPRQPKPKEKPPKQKAKAVLADADEERADASGASVATAWRPLVSEEGERGDPGHWPRWCHCLLYPPVQIILWILTAWAMVGGILIVVPLRLAQCSKYAPSLLKAARGFTQGPLVVFSCTIVAAMLFGEPTNGIDFGDGVPGSVPHPTDVQELVRVLKGGSKGRKKWNGARTPLPPPPSFHHSACIAPVSLRMSVPRLSLAHAS